MALFQIRERRTKHMFDGSPNTHFFTKHNTADTEADTTTDLHQVTDFTPLHSTLFPPLVHRKPLQLLQRHALQRPLIRRTQHHLRHLPIVVPAPRLERLPPPRHAKAPLAPVLQPHLPQIVSPTRGEIQELVCDDARDGVVARIGAWGLAVAVAEEAG